MPTLDNHVVEPVVRAILLGDSGSGKTGALASLALAGYNLFIADFDNGLDILANVIKDANPAALKRVDYQSFRDKHTMAADKFIPQTADAWKKGLRYIEKVLNDKDLSPDDILVIDSLSFAAKAAFAHILKMNSRLGSDPYQSDYGEAQRLVEGLAASITDPGVNCNILCTAHVAFLGDPEKGEVVRGFPALIGKALSPVLPRYFNHALLVRTKGTGGSLSRTIHTSSIDNIELKNVAPKRIAASYPLVTGLADYFKAARGTVPAAPAAAA